MRLYKNMVSLYLVQIFTYISPILVLPYLSRVLSIDHFGLLSLILSISAISLIIIDFGFNISSVNRISLNISNIDKVNSIFSSIIYIKILFSLIVSILVACYFAFFLKVEIELFLIFLIVINIVIQSFSINWFFQGISIMKNITIAVFFSRLIFIVLIFSYVKDDSIDSVIFSYVLSNLSLVFISFFLLYKNGYKLVSVSFKDVLFELYNSSHFFYSRISVITYTSANVFLLGQFSNLQQISYFSSVERLYQAGQQLASPISQSLYPYFAREKDFRLFFKLFILSFSCVLLLCSLLMFFSSNIIVLFYGDDFKGATNIFQIFIFIGLVNYVSIYFGYPAFSLLNKIKYANYSIIAASFIHVINIILLLAFNAFNAFNVAIVVLVTETSVAIFRVSSFFVIKYKSNLLVNES